jgi:two-component system, sensor histidine kinase and response regulator
MVPPDDPAPQLAAFDRALALSFMGDDEELLDELVLRLRDTAPSLLQRMRDGVASGALPAVALAAHSLRGSSSQLGALATAAACRELETAAETEDLAAVTPALLRVEGAVVALLATLP